MILVDFFRGTLAGLIPLALWTSVAAIKPPGEATPRSWSLPMRSGLAWWLLPTAFSLTWAFGLLVPALAPLLPLQRSPWTAALGLVLTALSLGCWRWTRQEQEARTRPNAKVPVLPFLLKSALLVTLTVLPSPGPLLALMLFALFGLMTGMEHTWALRSLDQQRSDAESAAWRARLAPHFVFNVLNGLQAQIPKDPGGAQATTEHLGRLFRQLIHLSQRPTVPLSDELAFVEDLLALHRARLGDRLEVALDIPEDTEDLELPTLALQILVENALKHGIEGLERGGRISILAKRDTWYEGDGPRHHLLLEVTNPVPPHRTDRSNSTGTGLASLRARLQRPEDLEIHATPERFTARLRWRQP